MPPSAKSAARAAVPAKAARAAPAAKPKRAAGKASGRGMRKLPPETVAEIFRRLEATNPEPKGELEHVNPFTLLVAVVLSAQATDAGVNKATRPLFQVADTPEKMAALGVERLEGYIRTIGLYRNKAKNVIALSEKLIAEHASRVPADRDALTALPGVGRKTANVVLNMAFGEKTMAVDTHVFRIAHRLKLSNGKTPDAVEADLMRIIPDQYLFHAHHWLILHGRYTCLARGPKCGACPVADLCTAKEKKLP